MTVFFVLYRSERVVSLPHFIACNEVRRNAFKSYSVKMVIEKTAIAVFFISSSMLQNIHKHQLTFPSFHGKIIR